MVEEWNGGRVEWWKSGEVEEWNVETGFSIIEYRTSKIEYRSSINESPDLIKPLDPSLVDMLRHKSFQ